MSPLRCTRKYLLLATGLAVLAMCWFRIWDRSLDTKRLVREIQQLRSLWKRNTTNIEALGKELEKCCEAHRLFAVTQQNTAIGTVLRFDAELFHSHTVDPHTYSLLVKEPPLPHRLSTCAVVGNGGILKNSGCGNKIDRAQFVIRCNLPPLNRGYAEHIGKRTHLVTANPSIIERRFEGLEWSRRPFLRSVNAYDRSFIYMPAFSSTIGTEPSFRAAHTLADASANQTLLFAHPDFLRRVSTYWASRGVGARRLSTGLFMLTLALSVCDQVDVYGFWPFPHGPDGTPLSHHYYDNEPPNSYHAMPQEFLQLWQLHKSGVIRLQLGSCDDTER
ncbi:hypothetical protein ACEWY4_010856 [Coilia grayii]|uniref:Alpha-N-acetylneuraminide alpha-2,8-sialyltransferase n=1 Tax=Coilia grayii TaxID=363190 RepID=A0ABD1K345_9TELE